MKFEDKLRKFKEWCEVYKKEKGAFPVDFYGSGDNGNILLSIHKDCPRDYIKLFLDCFGIGK